ncbi:hypothetical protein P4O66_002649 [Electrophorus voltai]|uniref:Uncharacterized protein n=1 Tax=Electrophorus voltai TaxID=2609070 RepID=A0AAD8YX04_9TELE|nr:hypothetical protein P4O66_002649 [Electrophorus voltai]
MPRWRLEVINSFTLETSLCGSTMGQSWSSLQDGQGQAFKHASAAQFPSRPKHCLTNPTQLPGLSHLNTGDKTSGRLSLVQCEQVKGMPSCTK